MWNQTVSVSLRLCTEFFIEVASVGQKFGCYQFFSYKVATNVSYLVWTVFGHLEKLIVVLVSQNR
jgi:hypothetical protein